MKNKKRISLVSFTAPSSVENFLVDLFSDEEEISSFQGALSEISLLTPARFLHFAGEEKNLPHFKTFCRA